MLVVGVPDLYSEYTANCVWKQRLEPLALQVPPHTLMLAAVFLRLILIAVAEVQDYLAEVALPKKLL